MISSNYAGSGQTNVEPVRIIEPNSGPYDSAYDQFKLRRIREN